MQPESRYRIRTRNNVLRLLAKSLAISIAITVSLIAGALSPGHRPGMELIRHTSTGLLLPGIYAGFAIGTGRVHDTSFWILTAILNVFIYWLFFGLLGSLYAIYARRKSRAMYP